MNKPSILFLSDVHYFEGGAERSLFDLMANPHIKPELVASAQGPLAEAAQDKSIPFHVIDYGCVLSVRRPFKLRDIFRTFFAALKAAKELKRLGKERGALCVHTNGLKAHGVACLSRLIGGRPVIIHIRSAPYTGKERLFWRVIQIIAAQMILVSRPCWFGKKLPGNVQVIFNAIDLPDRSIMPPLPPRRPFILGFAGRIHFSKGLDMLISWVAYACDKGLDIRLRIRGEAAPDEQNYAKKMRDLVKECGLKDICIFDGKFSALEKIFGGVHVNVVPSIVPDPLPRSVMEASALGIPVLGYPAGGIPHMFEDGKSGFLVKDEESFYRAVKSLMEDEGLYESVSAAAIENVRKNFAMVRLHDDVAKVYQSL